MSGVSTTGARSYQRLRPGPGLPAEDVAAQQRRRLQAAMVELVAAHGYGGVTMRALTGLAGVSTRAFYENFSDKEDCFLSTFELLARRAAERVVASRAHGGDWESRLRLAFRAFAAEVESDPDVARLAFVEVYTAGPAALGRIRRVERGFETMIARSFSRAPDDAPVLPLVVEGIVTGVAGSIRSRLLDPERAEKLPSLGDALADWALSYQDPCARALPALERLGAPRRAAFPEPMSGRGRTLSAYGADASILAAVAELAVADGYDQLTVARIRDRAGVSRAYFEKHFGSVERCFLAAIERHARSVFARAAEGRYGDGPWVAGIYRAMAALCAEVVRDPVFARLCLVEIFSAGAPGMSCAKRLVLEFAELLAGEEQAGDPPSLLVVEATATAILGLLHHQVYKGRAGQSERLVPTLTFLATAPLVGAPAAIDAIRHEQGSDSLHQL